MTAELINRGTIVIGVYMKEDKKEAIMEQLINTIHRINRKYTNPSIIVFGDFNTRGKWNIKHIEKKTKLK